VRPAPNLDWNGGDHGSRDLVMTWNAPDHAASVEAPPVLAAGSPERFGYE
jgi:hypothetical protein